MFSKILLGFLVYLVVGLVTMTIVAIAMFAIMAKKYGLDAVLKAEKDYDDLYFSGIKALEVLQFVIGLIVWPIRLSDSPIVLLEIKRICEENEKKNHIEGLAEEEGS